MSERPPFDTARGAFLLVTGVLGLHALAIVMTMAGCILNNAAQCNVYEPLRDLFAEVMAVALAFSRFPGKPN